MDVKGKDRIRLILAVILIASVGLRVASAIVLGDKIEILPGIFDQISYHTLANRLLSGNGFTSTSSGGQPHAQVSQQHTGLIYTRSIWRLSIDYLAIIRSSLD